MIVWIADLPKALTCDITITKLKGWQYAPEWVKIVDDFNLSMYKCKGVDVVCRSGEKVHASYIALTTGVGQLNFMLGNGVKLYILPHENKMSTAIQDRNYAEIVGLLQYEADQIEKAYVSTTMTSSMKKDIQVIRDKSKIRDQEVLAQSPLQRAKRAIDAIVSNEKLASHKEAEKLERQNNKIFLLKAK